MAEDSVNLGAVQYQDLSFSPGNLTDLKQPVEVPVIDGYDPFDPEQYKPTPKEDVFKDVKDRLYKGFKGILDPVLIPGQVYNADKGFTTEELIGKAVDMASGIIGRQLKSKFKAPRPYTNKLPLPDKNILNLGA